MARSRDDDEDDRPRRPSRGDDDEEDDRSRRSRRDEEEDEDRPRSRSRRDEDGEGEEEDRRRPRSRRDRQDELERRWAKQDEERVQRRRRKPRSAASSKPGMFEETFVDASPLVLFFLGCWLGPFIFIPAVMCLVTSTDRRAQGNALLVLFISMIATVLGVIFLMYRMKSGQGR